METERPYPRFFNGQDRKALLNSLVLCREACVRVLIEAPPGEPRTWPRGSSWWRLTRRPLRCPKRIQRLNGSVTVEIPDEYLPLIIKAFDNRHTAGQVLNRADDRYRNAANPFRDAVGRKGDARETGSSQKKRQRRRAG